MTNTNDLAMQKAEKRKGMPSLHETIATPLADIYETPEEYVVSLDMPGATKEAISVMLEQGVLHVSAAVAQHHTEDADVLYREIRTTAYQRAFALGEGVDRTNVDAVFQNGVLLVKLFKTPEAQPKQIAIH
jgi:HSP20 family protein